MQSFLRNVVEVVVSLSGYVRVEMVSIILSADNRRDMEAFGEEELAKTMAQSGGFGLEKLIESGLKP